MGHALHLMPDSYVAKTAPHGFRWTRLDRNGVWTAEDPPDGWGMKDGEPTLTESFFLSAPTGTWSSFGVDEPWDHGVFHKSEPDLYLKLASDSGSPDSILKYANRYGLLGSNLQRGWTKELLWPDYLADPRFSLTGKIEFIAEPAYSWLNTMGSLAHLLSRASGMDVPTPRQKQLLQWYNANAKANLSCRIEINSDTARPAFEVAASNLAGLVMVQWGLSITGHVQHRRCQECAQFFAVHPGLGRPEKRYCSHACQMRAHRRRKGQPVT